MLLSLPRSSLHYITLHCGAATTTPQREGDTGRERRKGMYDYRSQTNTSLVAWTDGGMVSTAMAAAGHPAARRRCCVVRPAQSAAVGSAKQLRAHRRQLLQPGDRREVDPLRGSPTFVIVAPIRFRLSSACPPPTEPVARETAEQKCRLRVGGPGTTECIQPTRRITGKA